MKDRVAWMDHWMRGIDNEFDDDDCDDDDDGDDCESSVVTYFDLHDGAKGLTPSGQKDSRTFPLEDTTWTDYYFAPGRCAFHPEASLRTSPPTPIYRGARVSRGPTRPALVSGRRSRRTTDPMS